MKYSTVFCLILVVLASSCSSVNAEKHILICGGFQAIETDDPLVQEAYAWLEERLASEYSLALGKVTASSIQVVAGYPIRLACRYTFQGEMSELSAVVYRDLEGSFELTKLELDIGNGI